MAEQEITYVVVNDTKIPAHFVVCPECKTLDLATVVVVGLNRVCMATCPKKHQWNFKVPKL